MRTLLPLLALSACVLQQPEPPTPNGPPTTVDPSTPPAPPTVRPGTPPPATPPVPTPAPQDCFEDGYEPNDAVATTASGAPMDLTLSAFDIDRFVVTLPAGATLSVDALFSNANGNLDLYVTTPAGDLLEWSISDDDDEWIDFVNDGPSRQVWIETNLFEADADVCLDYELFWSIETPATPPPPVDPPTPPPAPPTPPAPPVCTDDASEPNQDWESAPELLPVTDGYAVFDFVAADDDWFYLYATADEQLELTVRHDTPGAALDLVVWDEVGEVADLRLNRGVARTVVVNGGSQGQYIDLLVAPLDPDTCAPYTIEVVSTLPTCFEDAYEPNDGAAVFATPPLRDLSLFAGDVDRFAVTVYPGEELWVDAFFDGLYGNLDLTLLDADGLVVDTSYGTGDNETLTVFNVGPFAETFTIEADLYGADALTCQNYDLDWVIFGAACYDDALEGDDTAWGAAELVPAFGYSVTWDLVADDDDWFWIEQLPGEELDLFLEHATWGADLEIVVYDAFGEVGYDYTDAPGLEAYVPLYATSGTTYDVLIRPADLQTCVPYSLTVVSF